MFQIRYGSPVATTNPSRLRRGPRPGAEAEDVLAIARRRFFEGRPFDVSAIAAEAGIGRTTLWRWFGDRDALLGELLGTLSLDLIQRVERSTRKRGAERFLTVFERFLLDVTTSEPLLELLRKDPVGTASVLMSPEGRVYPRLVDATERLIEHEIAHGSLWLAIEPRMLANLTVEIGMVHTWANILSGQPPDVERALETARTLVTLERPAGSRS